MHLQIVAADVTWPLQMASCPRDWLQAAPGISKMFPRVSFCVRTFMITCRQSFLDNCFSDQALHLDTLEMRQDTLRLICSFWSKLQMHAQGPCNSCVAGSSVPLVGSTGMQVFKRRPILWEKSDRLPCNSKGFAALGMTASHAELCTVFCRR